MNKKIIVLLLIFTFMLVGCDKIKEKIKQTVDDPPIKESIPLFEFDKYKDFIIDNVTSLSIIRYTEGGADEEKITAQDKIQNTYYMLSKINIANETTKACEDNTTVYRFTMKDGTTTVIEIECDWLVVGNKRYEIEK